MISKARWVSAAAILLACVTACGGGTGDDDDASGAGEAGAGGGGGSGGTGGTSGGSGGTGGSQGGASGSSTGGSSTGGSSMGGSSTGGSSTGGSSTGGTGGAGGAGGTTGGSAGVGGSGGMSGMAGTGGTLPLAPGFTEGALLAEGVSASGEPMLRVNQAGVALVAWTGSSASRGGIWTIRYDPESETWGEPSALDTDESFAAELHDLALDELGNAYVAWKQGYIFVARYASETSAWTDSVQIEEHDDGGVGVPRVAAGPDGTALVLWTESDGSRTSQRFRRYDPASDEWSYWEAIDERDYNTSGTAAVAVDHAGNALAAWQQSGDSGVDGGLLVANRFDAQAGSWGTPEVLVPETGGTSTSSMTLAVDPDDNYFLVWNQHSTELSGDTQVWARRYAASGGWEEPVQLEAQTAFATTEPHLALDASGNALVVWTADDHLWSTKYSAEAGTWSEPVQVDDTAGWVAKWASVAMAPDGGALAVSAQWPAKDINLELDAVASRYDAATGEWGPGGVLEHHDDSAHAPSVGVDGRGKGFVVWRREREAKLWFSVYE